MRIRLITLLAILAIVAIAAYVKYRNPVTPVEAVDPMTIPAGPQRIAPEFTLIDQFGRPVRLADYNDQIVVLMWFNGDCPFIQRHYEEGTFDRLVEKWGDQGVQFIAVNSTKTWNVSRNLEFAKQHDIQYPILDDHTGRVGQIYNAQTTPHMFVIHKGMIVYDGAIDDDKYGDKLPSERVNYVNQAIEDLKNDRDVSTPRTAPYGCSVKYAQPGDDEAAGA